MARVTCKLEEARNAELMAFAWSGPERLENCSMFIRFNRLPFLDLAPLTRLTSSHHFLGFLPVQGTKNVPSQHKGS